MKKLLMLIAPVLIVLVAFRPVKSYTISGTVTDATGQPVAGASVMVKGTTIGTSTDFKGFFKLSVPDNGKTLIISAVGFDTKEISINGKTSVSITLVATTKSLQEVVALKPREPIWVISSTVPAAATPRW